MKHALLILSLLLTSMSYAQSKKELIIQVNDLKNQLGIEKRTKSTYKNQIDNLQTAITSLNTQISNLTNELNLKKSEAQNQTQELSKIKEQFKVKSDSLSVVVNELETTISNLNSQVSNLTNELYLRDLEAQNQTQRIAKFEQQLRVKSDSLSIVLNELDKLKCSAAVVEIPDANFNKYLIENESSNDILIIDVVNKFEDFNVVIYWLPRISDIPYGFDYVGPALICFKNSIGDIYFVHNLFFTLPADGLPILKDELSNRAIIQGNNIIKRSFPQKVYSNFPDVDTNFLFLLDIDFDGKPELFTTGHRQGQRGFDTYIPIFGGNEISTYHEGPYVSSNIYNNLDGLSEISARDKTIKIRYSNGAENSYAELYKMRIDRYGNGKFEFYKRVEW